MTVICGRTSFKSGLCLTMQIGCCLYVTATEMQSFDHLKLIVMRHGGATLTRLYLC